MEDNFDVIIIGAGPAGISAAIWCKRLGMQVKVIEQSEKIGGQLKQIANTIKDYPGLITENGIEMIETFKKHLTSLNIDVSLREKVLKIDHKNHKIITNQSNYHTKFVIISTGSGPKRLHIPGEKELYERNEIYSTSKDLHRFKGKIVTIVGGGDHAIEGALNIASIAEKVIVIHRSSNFTARKKLLNEALGHSKIEIWQNSIIKEIIHKNNTVHSVFVDGNHNGKLHTDIVLIRIGVSSNDGLFPSITRDTMTNKVHSDHIGRTSLSWLFAIGDVVTSPWQSSISNAIAQGMIAAKTISLEV
jgi:thioredoxin reductase (NADPH)